MKRLIEGRVFDTEEMDVIAETVLFGEYHTDFNYHAVEILIDENGNFLKRSVYYLPGDSTLELVTKQDVINWCEEINYDMDDDNLLANLELGDLK